MLCLRSLDVHSISSSSRGTSHTGAAKALSVRILPNTVTNRSKQEVMLFSSTGRVALRHLEQLYINNLTLTTSSYSLLKCERNSCANSTTLTNLISHSTSVTKDRTQESQLALTLSSVDHISNNNPHWFCVTRVRYCTLRVCFISKAYVTYTETII